MRLPVLLALTALLVAAPATAHGDGPKTIAITDEGCVLSEPPCLVPDSGSSIEAGATTVVRFTNQLDSTLDVMVHLDRDGQVGGLIAGVKPLAPGERIDLSVDVPADASGVWYMASGDDGDIVLFGEAVADEHHAPVEESPGPGILALLGLVALATLLRRS